MSQTSPKFPTGQVLGENSYLGICSLMGILAGALSFLLNHWIPVVGAFCWSISGYLWIKLPRRALGSGLMLGAIFWFITWGALLVASPVS